MNSDEIKNANPIINVLIRVSRPELFERCIESVLDQSYNNIRIVCSYDSKDAQQSVSSLDTYPYENKYVCVWDINKTPYHYNLFCNYLKAACDEGYIIYLDDDDYLNNPNSIERIIPYLKEDELLICQMLRGDRPKPADMYMDKKVISKGRIGMPCFIFHSKHKNIADFGATEDADYLFIKALSEKIKTKFVKQVVVNSPARSYGL